MTGESTQTVPAPDPEAWLEKYGDVLYAFALARVRRHEVAEDVVQETLLAALSAREVFRNEAAERTWLVGILKHKIYDHFRRQFRDPGPPLTEEALEGALFDGAGAWKRPPETWGIDPRALAEKDEFWKAFHGCLDGLPSRSRLAFAAQVIDEEDSAKICRDLQVSPANLWVILHRARLLLRACLEQSWFGGSAGGGEPC
ncbi:MAG: sigma-70 family RNA polymerase sigma factor [Planctomycetes bacterium]|nr:sigma-70 family RNA polymerase sigma factor [Planctomycetota bacterium]